MIKISEELANAILGYLGKQPYQDVYQLISAIQQSAKKEEENNE